MAFDEIRFPTSISRGSTGGPERRTEIVVTGSGEEARNSRWSASRRRYEAGFGVKSLNDLHQVLRFFEERRGRLHGFRWKDFTDYKSCPPQNQPAATDQVIGTGDGATLTFQLVKRYGSGLRDYVRIIGKPVAGTVIVAVNGVIVPAATVAPETGTVTFPAPQKPAAGAIVTAGFEFDVPVRFDTDEIKVNLAGFTAGTIPAIPVVEIRP